MNSLDTPARLAVVGANPIGLEAALYARFLGYEVLLFEQATPAAGLLAEAAANVATPPIRSGTSPLGLAALHAQDAAFTLPASQKLWTARQWVEHYFAKLAATDLLDGCLLAGCRVTGIEDLAEVAANANSPQREADQSDDPEADLDEDMDADADADHAPDRFAIHFEVLTADAQDRADAVGSAPVSSPQHVAAVIDATGGSGTSLPSWYGPLAARFRAETQPATSSYHTEVPYFYRLGLDADQSLWLTNPAAAHDQIRALFAMLGDRETLDLYGNFRAIADQV